MEIVSVIVPVYNVEKYLKDCVDSLLHQSYRDLEIILVDDGSQDSSGEICDEYLNKDHRIKVIHKKNCGLGFARNSGLEIANGKYVVFIDSDDTTDNDLIASLLKPVLDDGADTCISGFKKISESGDLEFIEKYDSAVYEKKEIYPGLFARMLGSSVNKHDAIRMSACSVLYSMDIIRKNNIRFPSERKLISEDLIWNSDYFKYAQRAAVIDSTGYNYRTTSGSLTQKYNANKLEMVCAFYLEMCRRIGNSKDMRTRLQRQFFVNIRTCLNQEKPSVSGNNRRHYREKVNKIMNEPTVVETLNEYPIRKMQFKQRVFLLILKSRIAELMMFFIDIGLV